MNNGIEISLNRVYWRWVWSVKDKLGNHAAGVTWRRETASRQLMAAFDLFVEWAGQRERQEFRAKLRSVNFGSVPGGAREAKD